MAKFKKWEYATDNTISVVGGATTNPKKITGTRLGALLGLNKWKTDFEVWCEIMRVGEQPFEGNKYTEAGIAIEPKLMEWCKTNVSPYIITPEEWFGTSRKLYDHFPEQKVFGGMWDGLTLDNAFNKGGKPNGVLEGKTSSRPQDWQNNTVPASYEVQALMYAFLSGVDDVYLPVAFLNDNDYDNPQAFECSDDNTYLYHLKVSESNIAEQLDYAITWWQKHVIGNVSPAFDEVKDKAILAVIRKSEVKSDELEGLAHKTALLEAKIEVLRDEAGLPDLEKELKELKDRLKDGMIPMFSQTDTVVSAYGWKLKMGERVTIDKKRLEEDNLLQDYSMKTTSYTLTKEN